PPLARRNNDCTRAESGQHSGSRRRPMIRPKTLVFAFIAVMMIYVITHNERFLVSPDSPDWDHYSKLGLPLFFHGAGGACALLLAPLQFSDRLRRRYTKMHRIVGRIYCAGAFVLAPIGVYVQYLDYRLFGDTRTFVIATAVDAALLFTTTAIALAFAMPRKITQHRPGMTRTSP